jgi:hypothetical protein
MRIVDRRAASSRPREMGFDEATSSQRCDATLRVVAAATASVTRALGGAARRVVANRLKILTDLALQRRRTEPTLSVRDELALEAA